MEYWIDISGYPNYRISNLGKVIYRRKTYNYRSSSTRFSRKHSHDSQRYLERSIKIQIRSEKRYVTLWDIRGKQHHLSVDKLLRLHFPASLINQE